MEELMTKLPWWLNLLIKILFVDLVIALFVAGWSWIAKDFNMISLSNRFFAGGSLSYWSALHPVRGILETVPIGGSHSLNLLVRQT